MSSELLLDATGRRRSPAAMPGHNAGHAPSYFLRKKCFTTAVDESARIQSD